MPSVSISDVTTELTVQTAR